MNFRSWLAALSASSCKRSLSCLSLSTSASSVRFSCRSFKREILLSIELPLSAPVILAGVRIAAVINVGTATIAAFIGSGGLGELIVQGLTLNDLVIMQQGAVPAALLAIVVNVFFTFFEKRFSFVD